MTAPGTKYTDRQIKEDPSLLGIAVQYARSYGGDFDPLLGAKGLVHQTGTLPVPIARVVLNCMRNDARVQNQLPEVIDYSEEFIRAPRLQVVRNIPKEKKPPRKRYVRLNVKKWHMKYGISTYKNSCVVHEVDQSSSYCVYNNETQEVDFRVSWICGPGPVSLETKLLPTQEFADRRPCKGCARLKMIRKMKEESA